MPDSLTLIVRTPAEVVLECYVSSVRIPTESGQVGLRRRAEPMVLAIEPGLVLVRAGDRFTFVGTAGGLVRLDGCAVRVLTPLAVTGTNEREVLAALDQALATPNAELEARAMLGQLQGSILRELRGERRGFPHGPERTS